MPNPDDTPSPNLRSAGPSVLVVDDEENITYLVASALQLAGMTVHTRGTGAEALEAATGHSYDAVILDVMLPDLDGFEVLRRLRARGISAPVLFLTARAQTAAAAAANKSGCWVVLDTVLARAVAAIAASGEATF